MSQSRVRRGGSPVIAALAMLLVLSTADAMAALAGDPKSWLHPAQGLVRLVGPLAIWVTLIVRMTGRRRVAVLSVPAAMICYAVMLFVGSAIADGQDWTQRAVLLVGLVLTVGLAASLNARGAGSRAMLAGSVAAAACATLLVGWSQDPLVRLNHWGLVGYFIAFGALMSSLVHDR